MSAPASPPSDKPRLTLADLRAFHDDRVAELEGRRDVRGFWPGEETARDVHQATVKLIDIIAGDEDLLARVAAKARAGK